MSNDSVQKRARLVSSAAQQVLASGSRAVIVTVIDSTPDALIIGAKLLVRDSGETTGSLGSADVDENVARYAPEFLRSRDEARAVTIREFAPEASFGDTKILFERIEAEPRLVIAGAGHVGASLARFAALAGFRVTLVDDRGEFLARELFASPREQPIELVVADEWQQAMRDAVGNGRGVSVAIVTRGHKQDEECLRATLSAKPNYVGMIGSKRRTNIVLEKLREEGADENELGKVRAPIGLDIGAVSPEEVALAILAEIIAERRGGSGLPLSSWRRR
jgi:xanthine dehydrogenase accessory factor